MQPSAALWNIAVRLMTLVSTYGIAPVTLSENDLRSSMSVYDENNDIVSNESPDILYTEKTRTKLSNPDSSNLKCFECRASQNNEEVNYESALYNCMHRAAETAEAKECPTFVANQTVQPYCYVNKMKAAGHTTSFSRGCMVTYPCHPVDDCETHVNQTGSCQTCCQSDYCNRAADSRWPILHGSTSIMAN